MASFAFYIHAFSKNGTIQLPRVRLGKWLGVSPRTVTSLVNLLEAQGIIKCSDLNYSYQERRAKSYKFVATDAHIQLPPRR